MSRFRPPLRKCVRHPWDSRIARTGCHPPVRPGIHPLCGNPGNFCDDVRRSPSKNTVHLDPFPKTSVRNSSGTFAFSGSSICIDSARFTVEGGDTRSFEPSSNVLIASVSQRSLIQLLAMPITYAPNACRIATDMKDNADNAGRNLLTPGQAAE